MKKRKVHRNPAAEGMSHQVNRFAEFVIDEFQDIFLQGRKIEPGAVRRLSVIPKVGNAYAVTFAEPSSQSYPVIGNPK
jgi:hypothetical protein